MDYPQAHRSRGEVGDRADPAEMLERLYEIGVRPASEGN
jgi:hypothetical protein